MNTTTVGPSAFALTDLSKELFLEPVCLLVPSSPGPRLSKRAPEGHRSTLRDDPEALL